LAATDLKQIAILKHDGTLGAENAVICW